MSIRSVRWDKTSIDVIFFRPLLYYYVNTYRTSTQSESTQTERQEAGEMVWMTDRTPHESVSIPAGTKRRYVRLVCSDVTAWYAAHSTPNPLGVVPPEDVKIIQGDKFIGYSQHN